MMSFRIPQVLHQEMRSDLRRSHPFALERVGFAFIKTAGENTLVTTGYLPVPDEFYINDQNVGARIDHRAIARAMKRADQNNEGILQVHKHARAGTPVFSRADIADHPNFLRSFRNAAPKMPHGFLLLSNDKMMTRIWLPESTSFVDIFRYTIVGMPLSYNWFGRIGDDSNE